MRVIILDKNSHLKFHSISLAFLVRKKDQKQISLEITRQRNKHSMTRNLMVIKLNSIFVPTMYRLVDLLDYPFVKKVSYQAFNSIREKALSNQRVVKITSGKLFQILIDGFDLIFLVRQRLFCVLSLPSLVNSTVFEFSLTILSILRFD